MIHDLLVTVDEDQRHTEQCLGTAVEAPWDCALDRRVLVQPQSTFLKEADDMLGENSPWCVKRILAFELQEDYAKAMGEGA
jgi:hypothetical protein